MLQHNVLGMLIFQLHSDFMLRLFDASDEMMAIGVPALKIISYSFPFAALCIMGSSLFQAIGDGRLSFFSSALRQLAILLPVAFHILPYPRPVRRMVCLPHIRAWLHNLCGHKPLQDIPEQDKAHGRLTIIEKRRRVPSFLFAFNFSLRCNA